MKRADKHRILQLLWGSLLGCLVIATAMAESSDSLSTKLTFELDDLAGKAHSLRPEDGQKAVALVFLSTECPIAQSYVSNLNQLHVAWSKQHVPVKFFGVISDPYVTPADAKKFVDEFKIEFPLLMDDEGKLAKLLTPTHVPEAFVIDRQMRLAYRGRIDDVYAEVGRRRPAPTQNDLQDAVAAVINGFAVKATRTTPVGCPFEVWKRRGKATDQ